MLGDEYLVSYDVQSLFTNVPSIDAIHLASELLPESCFLSKDVFKDLLFLCSRNTLLTYQDDVYQPVYGVAKGSPLATLIANIYMTQLESLLNKSPVTIQYWKRYVDGILGAGNNKRDSIELVKFF